MPKRTKEVPYYDRNWRRERIQFLVKHPLCAMCKRQGKLRRATVVDHIVPHKGNVELFWDWDNWQPLCAHHHSSTKQTLEKSGKLLGVDKLGRPTHPDHPWNKRTKP